MIRIYFQNIRHFNHWWNSLLMQSLHHWRICWVSEAARGYCGVSNTMTQQDNEVCSWRTGALKWSLLFLRPEFTKLLKVNPSLTLIPWKYLFKQGNHLQTGEIVTNPLDHNFTLKQKITEQYPWRKNCNVYVKIKKIN